MALSYLEESLLWVLLFDVHYEGNSLLDFLNTPKYSENRILKVVYM